MSNTENSTIENALNTLLNAFIPYLNEKLPEWIDKEGLDPLSNVVSGHYKLDKVNLGVCHAEAKAAYHIKNLKGLSSIEIGAATLAIDDDSDASNIIGSVTANAKFNKTLTTDLDGEITAKCGIVHEHVGISGKADAKDVSGNLTIDYKASVSSREADFIDLKIIDMTLDYSSLNVKIDHLGFFNDFLEVLENEINDVFGDWIKDALSAILKPVLNDLLNDLTPYSISLDN